MSWKVLRSCLLPSLKWIALPVILACTLMAPNANFVHQALLVMVLNVGVLLASFYLILSQFASVISLASIWIPITSIYCIACQSCPASTAPVLGYNIHHWRDLPETFHHWCSPSCKLKPFKRSLKISGLSCKLCKFYCLVLTGRNLIVPAIFSSSIWIYFNTY